MGAVVVTFPTWLLWLTGGAFAVMGLIDLWLMKFLLRRMRAGDDLIRAVRAINVSTPAEFERVESGDVDGIRVKSGWRALKLGKRMVVDIEDVIAFVEFCEGEGTDMEWMVRALRVAYGSMLAPGAYDSERGWVPDAD